MHKTPPISMNPPCIIIKMAAILYFFICYNSTVFSDHPVYFLYYNTRPGKKQEKQTAFPSPETQPVLAKGI